MSSPPPHPHLPAVVSRVAFVRPLALVCMLVSVVMLVYFLLQAGAALLLADGEQWQHLQHIARQYQWPASLQWLLLHPVQASLLLAAVCVPALAACWGLYRERRWGLWSFAALLMITALANLGLVWWFDSVVHELISIVDDAAFQQEAQQLRILFSLLLLGTSILFLGLHGWLAWRLLRPDVRARF